MMHQMHGLPLLAVAARLTGVARAGCGLLVVLKLCDEAVVVMVVMVVLVVMHER